MTLAEYMAYLEGARNQQMHREIQAINTGYWSGYYINAGKKAKPPAVHIQKMMKKTKQSEQRRVEIEDMNSEIAKFEKREQKRRETGR